ncbi:hypothetical protein CYMTET_15028 [Cymbomonas tetramitiformis]|uniref:Integrase catalytic domain-containing protein n=1 Tax=Cymbomonas tetramitiformis TaxID=36881 RepID=A0AAE0GF68_9CHLO|nr:hypothetical protein CYMTET_15028 [Cymbomonas tetramitiformis]
MVVLERPHFPVDGIVASHTKLVCAGHAVAEESGLLQRLLKREPTMVRGSFVRLQSWVTLLSMVTRDTGQVVESFWALLGYDIGEEWDSGSSSDGSFDGGYASDPMPDLDSASDSDEEEDVHLGQPYEGVGGIPYDDWASGLFHPLHWSVAEEWDSGSSSDGSSDGGYASDTMPDLESASDSDEEEDVHLGQPYEGVGGIPSDDWASGLFHLPHWSVALGDSGMPVEADVNSGLGDYCSSDWYCDIPGLEDGSDSGDEDACELHGDHPVGRSLALYVASTDNTADIFTRALPLPTFSGKVALLDSGATKHIFNLVSDFGSDFDPASGSTFSVVQASTVSSVGSGTVTFAKLDVSTGRAIGLQFAAYHDDSDRDNTDWKFEKAGKHLEEHGPFTLELFASIDNHILDDYCTTGNPCFCRDWAGKACYGNPPYEHDIILRCLQKALSDFTRFAIVHEYPAGEKIFSAPLDSCYNVENLEMCGESRVWVRETKWPVVVIYKGGHTVMKLDAKMLAHLRLGHIGDVTMQEMLDEKVLMGIATAQYTKSLVWRCPDRSRMGLDEKYHMVLHTDGDTTMIVGQTEEYCKDQGIEQRHGSPYLHENQARVERSHRTVQAMARALLLTSGFGVDMWPLAVRHSVYILNRTFRRREHKLSDRARQLRYVGHSEVSSAYLLYDPESGKIVKSGMVKFHEAVDKLGKVVTTWDPSAVAPLSTNFMVTALDGAYHDILPSGLEDGVLEVGAYLPDDSDEILAVLKVQATDETGDLNVNYPLFTEVTVDAGSKEMEAGIICARAVGASSVPYCVMLLTNFTHIDLPVGRVQFPPEHTCLAAVGKACAGGSVDVLPDGVTEPKGVKQAMEAPDADEWMDAIQTELEALVTVKKALLMMDLEDVPPGVRLLDMSLVLKIKLDKHRQLQKRKARVCLKGNKQEYGVDYFDTFAPCTQLSSVRLIIILALNLALEVYHMDVETAFLNSTLEEDLYVKLPRGLEYQGRTCAKLLKAVYGLKQAGKEWFETSDAFIMGYDERMRRSDVEPCLYYIRDSGITVIILAYVDDYLVATDSRSWYDSFVAAFNSQYACKDLGVLDLVMGIEHFVALKQVVRYLKGTVNHELVLRTTFSEPRGLGLASGALPLCIYTDADYAGCKTTRRSTSGIAVYLCGSLLISSSIMQRCVSLSTTEAEIIAMSEGAREIKYIINVLNDLVDICNPVPMYCDNQGAIHLASDYVNNNRSKHIEVRNMCIRELVKSKMMEALYVASADNTADIFTKPLPLPAFLTHREGWVS